MENHKNPINHWSKIREIVYHIGSIAVNRKEFKLWALFLLSITFL